MNNERGTMEDEDKYITEKPGHSYPTIVAVIAIIVNIILHGVVLWLGGASLVAAANGVNILPNIVIIVGLIIVISALYSSTHIQQPGNATVYQFLGGYVGTVRKTGLYATLPFLSGTVISIKDQNFETPVSKVNDLNGNPINISAIVVWRAKDTARATFSVEDYFRYLATQAEAAVRHVAASHPYDSGDTTIEVNKNTPSLLGSADVINEELLTEITDRAKSAGVEILEVRINNLSYAQEIAQAMLQRQQAKAIIDARKIIVEGALGIVEDTVKALSEDNKEISDETKGNLISNLLIVLVGEGKVTPTLNVDSTSRKK